MNYIVLNGVNSNTITGLIIQELPPISKPLMRTQIDQIDGRDGDIVTKLGYSTVDKELSIGLHGNFDIDSVIEYFASEGTVIFSNEPDKYYRYQVLEQIDFERLVRFRTATVTMHCQPFKYEVNEDPIEENSTVEEDSVPYAFRKSPYGDREFDEVVGGSVAWNQLVSNSTFPIAHSENGITNTWADNTMTIVGTASTASWIYVQRANGDNIAPNNHVYMVMSTYVPNDVRFGVLKDNGSFVYGADGQNTVLVKNDVGIRAVNFRHPANVAYNYSTKPQLFDLTQMFGSTIADYIYSLEQSSTGSGVAFFRGLFPKPYYAYNAGQLISVSGLSAHKMTGFNQWDEQWRNGHYNGTTGAYSQLATKVCNVNPIRVLPNTTYYVQTPVSGTNIFLYDADMNYISPILEVSQGSTFTTPPNACWLNFSTFGSSYTVYNHDICINISGERNGEYEPYESHSYALDDSLTLRGVPKLVDNKVQFDGDIYSSDGSVQRRYEIVTLNGSESWGMNTTSHNGYVSMNSVKRVSDYRLSMISSYLPVVAQAGDFSTFTEASWVSAYHNNGASVGQNWIYVHIDGITTVADLKAYLANKPLTLVYELATSTTESAEPYVNPQICNEYGTEEYVSAEQSGVTMIVGHNTKYSSQISATIINKGNTGARPTLTISGVGDVIVLLNGQQIFQIALGDTGNITIDAEQMEAYHGGLLRNRLVTGDYNNFVLQSGENVLQFVGYVTSAEITNYSRWL